MFEVLDEVCTPTKGSEFSACIDLYARRDIVISAGETVLVPLGVKIGNLDNLFKSLSKEDKEIQIDMFKKSHQLNLHIRSSMSAKYGLTIANGTGIIDMDYDGEIMICLHNPIDIQDICFAVNDNDISELHNPSFREIKRGQKVAQISLVEHKSYLFGVESVDKRAGGFGSTDKLKG